VLSNVPFIGTGAGEEDLDGAGDDERDGAGEGFKLATAIASILFMSGQPFQNLLNPAAGPPP